MDHNCVNPEILKVVIESAEFPHIVHGRHELERPIQHVRFFFLITQLGYVSAVLMYSEWTTIVSNPENIKVVIETAEFPQFVYGRHELERPSQHILKYFLDYTIGIRICNLMYN